MNQILRDGLQSTSLDQEVPDVASHVDVSVVIPARNEADNLPDLIGEICTALSDHRLEIIVVNDGSTDTTGQALDALIDEGRPVVRFDHAHSLGQSAALQTGARIARGATIATLDGDGQNDPAFLPAALSRLSHGDVALVAGQRLGRKARFTKRWGSWIANRVRSAVLGDSMRDTGCGLKVFRRDAFLDLPYFQTMHRFLPALFIADGWQIAQIDVVDRPRLHGASKYGVLDRLLVSIPDLLGVWWLSRRRRKNPFTQLREQIR